MTMRSRSRARSGETDASGRRRFLRQTLGVAGAMALPGAPVVFTQALNAPNPFTLGVASGDPDPQGIVLWTRLAPEPLTYPRGVTHRAPR